MIFIITEVCLSPVKCVLSPGWVIFLNSSLLWKEAEHKAVLAICGIDSVNGPLARFPHKARQHAFGPPCVGSKKMN